MPSTVRTAVGMDTRCDRTICPIKTTKETDMVIFAIPLIMILTGIGSITAEHRRKNNEM